VRQLPDAFIDREFPRIPQVNEMDRVVSQHFDHFERIKQLFTKIPYPPIVASQPTSLMRHFKSISLFLASCCLLLSPLQAQQLGKKATASDVYLRAYLTMEDGMKLLQGEDYAGSYYKLKDAKDLFDSVFHSDPNWNPEIVDYRRKKVGELMESARQQEMQRRARAAAAPGTVNPVAPPGTLPAPAALPMPGKKTTTEPRAVDAVLQAKVGDLQDRIRQVEAKNEAMLKEIGSKDNQLLDSQHEQQRLKERLVEASTQLDTAKLGKNIEKGAMQKEIDRLKKLQEKLTADLSHAADLLKDSNEKNATLLTEVKQAYAVIKNLNEEKTKLTAERDQLNELLGGADGKSEKVRALANENARLNKTMAELQARMTAMQKEREAEKKDVAATKEELAKQREADQKLIADLRGQLETARGELAKVKQENQDYQNQMAALSARLDATERVLAASANPGLTESDAIKENNLLHEIIVKMIKQQAGRERAKKQALAELEETGKMSEQLVSSIQSMAEPYQMTQAERALLQATGATKWSEDGTGVRTEIISPEILGSRPPGDSPTPAENVNPDELRAYATAAQRLFTNQQFDEAEANYEKILRADPLNHGARCNMAVTQISQGKMDAAILNLKKALAYNFENDFPHYLLGTVYLRQNKLDEATESISTALKLRDDNGGGHFALGLIHTKQKHFIDAEREFKKAVQFDPGNGEAHYNLAIIYATSETPKMDLAKNHYRQAISHGIKRDSNLDKLLERH
jgi:Tfp pilus assembly protein PilF